MGYWKHPQFWAIVTLALIRIGLLVIVWAGVIDFTPDWANRAGLLDALLLCWIVYGWWRVRTFWLGWVGVGIAGVFAGDLLWANAQQAGSIAIYGTITMGVVLIVGLRVLRIALSPGVGVLGVARTLIDEAMRMKIAVGLIFGVFSLVSVLPIILAPNDRLDYRMQTYLTWGLSGSVGLLSLMTLFLGCGTVSGDLCQRQIYLTLTKPITRAQYLFGKWVGIASLNLLLVGLTGAGVYVFSQVVEHQTALGQLDRDAVRSQVLVARQTISPVPPAEMNLAVLVEDQIEKLRGENPDLSDQPIPVKTRRLVEQAVIARWHNIDPMDSKTYLFTGLKDVSRSGDTLQLRLRAQSGKTPPDGVIHLWVWVNDRPYQLTSHLSSITVKNDHFHVIPIPGALVDEVGNLKIKITNINPDNPRATFPSAVRFTPGSGLQLLYRVGEFGPNLTMAMLMIWVRLGFLAGFGLMASTFLSFPVACLLSLMIYFIATAHGFLVDSSMQYYKVFPTGEATWFDGVAMIWESGDNPFGVIAGLFVKCLMMLLPSFSDYNPVPLISDGRRVTGEMLGGAALRIGVLWSGGCGLIGWIIFRSRELARVTV